MQKLILPLLALFSCLLQAHEPLVDTVQKVMPSIVGIGIFKPLGAPQNNLTGSGFVIPSEQAGKTWIVTNHHVIESVILADDMSRAVVFVGKGQKPKVYKAEIEVYNKFTDLAILSIDAELPALTLAKADYLAPDATAIAFTGFPIGSVLGLYPATHRGIIAAYTPVAIPQANTKHLSAAMLAKLKKPLFTYQLDATAYPGNSGSALYKAQTGEVIGIINKVLVKQTKENVLSDPSAITYAIPIKYLHKLIEKYKNRQ